VDARYVLDGQRLDVLAVALGGPLEAVGETDDFHAMVDRFDGDGADDAIDARSRAAAYHQGQLAVHE
jgi:hypothetical protein